MLRWFVSAISCCVAAHLPSLPLPPGMGPGCQYVLSAAGIRPRYVVAFHRRASSGYYELVEAQGLEQHVSSDGEWKNLRGWLCL
jgi:hypothetical protein